MHTNWILTRNQAKCEAAMGFILKQFDFLNTIMPRKNQIIFKT